VIAVTASSPAAWRLDLDHHANVQRTSLALPEDLVIDAWRRIGERIFALSDASGWWLGDWLVFGERKYPDRYRRAMQGTSLNYQTLRNYAWAARRFHPSVRRAGLSVQHHIEVAARPPEEQDHWLDFAERLHWTRDELRRHMRAGTPRGRPRLQLQLDHDHLSRWEDAARRAGRDLTGWIIEVLDAAASRA
jgi:hypothetical protein